MTFGFYLIGNYVSLIPLLLTFTIFVLPSSAYKQAFQQEICRYRRILFNLLYTGSSCVLAERKTKNKKSLSLAFCQFISAVCMFKSLSNTCISVHFFFYIHMFFDTTERQISFFVLLVFN